MEKRKRSENILKNLNFNLNGQLIIKSPTAYHWSVPDKCTKCARHACHMLVLIALFLPEHLQNVLAGRLVNRDILAVSGLVNRHSSLE